MAVDTSIHTLKTGSSSGLIWLVRAVELILIALIAFLAAQALWFVIYGDAVRPLDLEPEITLGSSSTTPVSDVSILSQSGLFAARDSIAPVVSQAVPETRLNLALRGVRAGGDPTRGAAFIETPNLGQRSFAAGDSITDGVVLEEIFEDRVIINRRGARESLFISEEAARRAHEAQRVIPPAQTPVSPLSNPVPSEGGSALSGQPDLDVAGSLEFEDWVEGLRLAPSIQNGQITGFRVRANAHLEILRAAGLQPGDIITVLNGENLNDPQAAQRALAGLENEDTLTLTLVRNGAPLVVNVPLN